jgi:hypothetical protein
MNGLYQPLCADDFFRLGAMMRLLDITYDLDANNGNFSHPFRNSFEE